MRSLYGLFAAGALLVIGAYLVGGAAVAWSPQVPALRGGAASAAVSAVSAVSAFGWRLAVR